MTDAIKIPEPITPPEAMPLLSPEQIERIMRDEWKVSDQAIDVLKDEPEVFNAVSYWRSVPPLPPGYIPGAIEEKFEGLVFRRWEYPRLSGEPTYTRPVPSEDYQPLWVSWWFDEDMALLHIDGEVLVNRAEAMAAQAAHVQEMLQARQ